MADNHLQQELAELVADLKDLAGALATTAPVRCRQLLALTSSVERHFQHLSRCDDMRARDVALREAREDYAVTPKDEFVQRLPQAKQQPINADWQVASKIKSER
jgi:hypothetical protein